MVRFFPKVETAYMRLRANDLDTLQVTYQTYTTKCCGTITEITNIRFNDAVNIPGSRRVQEIRK